MLKERQIPLETIKILYDIGRLLHKIPEYQGGRDGLQIDPGTNHDDR